MKNTRFILLAAMLIGALSFGLYVKSARAETKVSGAISVTYDGSFSRTNLKPGDSASKKMTVHNNGAVSHSFALAVRNVSGNYADKLYLVPTVDNVPVWHKSVEELSSDSEPIQSFTVIESLNPGQSVDVYLNSDLDSSLNNDQQYSTVSFDLVFGTQEVEPTPVPSATVGMASFTGATLARLTSPLTSQTASPTPSASVSSTSVGEVKGAQANSNSSKGVNPLLLAIAPAAFALAIPVLISSAIRNVALPTTGGLIAAVLGFFVAGSMSREVFYVLLTAEVLFFFILDYFIIRRFKSDK